MWRGPDPGPLACPLPRSTLKLWVPLIATVLAVKAGEHVSGPSLNSGAPCCPLARILLGGGRTACWIVPFPPSRASHPPCHPPARTAFTFAFAYLYPAQSMAEHVLVYWLAPVAAGIFGGWAYQGFQQWERQRQQVQRRAKVD